MVELVVSGLTKRYGAVAAVDGIGFEIADGEFLSLLGPSGCGKSTTLGAVAGLEQPDAGLIRAGATVLSNSADGTFLPPEERNCGLVFQSYALWPHMTVGENVAFGLKLRKVPRVERQKRVQDVLDLVEMGALAGRYPHELSGGQQQRVALARTLVYRPSVLLLDEPLSNLDAKLRERARAWLRQLQGRIRLTTLYVTHDQAEALALSDRIAVMNNGRIAQLGTPQEIYRNPADPFVADFIGTSNLFAGRARRLTENRDLVVALEGGQEIVARSREEFAPDTPVMVAVRPEALQLCRGPEQRPDGEGTLLPAKLVSRSYLGARYQYVLDIGGLTGRTETHEEFSGDVAVWIPSGGCVVFQR